jgi:hypothetical protein
MLSIGAIEGQVGPIYHNLLSIFELVLEERLFFVLFPVSQCQTGLFSPSSKHEWYLLVGL